jgi:hypothetical protein
MTDRLQLSDEEERAVASFMARVAALPSLAPARDAMQLWWKAQLLRRWDASRRAQAPLDVAERIEIVAGLIAACLLLGWVTPTVIGQARLLLPLISGGQ